MSRLEYCRSDEDGKAVWELRILAREHFSSIDYCALCSRTPEIIASKQSQEQSEGDGSEIGKNESSKFNLMRLMSMPG